MSRGRKRKTEKGNFSEASMKRAVEEVVRHNVSLRVAASNNNVKFQTLFRYVKKLKADPNKSLEEVTMKPNYQSRLIFTSEQEKMLVDYILRCSKMCYGKSTIDVRKLAYEMAKINSIPIHPSWEDSKRASIDWMQAFIKRNPEVSIRQPENCSMSRATSFNKHNNYLRMVAVCTILTKQERLDNKKSNSTKRHEASCIVSATGNSLPPVMVFPRKYFKPPMINGAPPGTLGLANPSGWMNGELFVNAMQHFIHHSGSHLTINTLNLAKDHGVTIVTLPPHCSNKLQPLDVSVFASFKAHYNRAVDSWLLHHPDIPLTIYDIVGCVGVAHDRAMTPSNIKSDFRKTGIFPFDRNIFTDDDFLVSAVTDREDPNTKSHEQTTPSAESITLSSIRHSTPPPSTCRSSTCIPSTCTPSTSNVRGASKPFISPQEFEGFPKAGERKKTRNIRKGRSLIPTDTPEKDQKRNKKKKPHVRKVFTSKKEVEETSESEMEISSSDDIEWPPKPDDDMEEATINREPREGDFVLVKFSAKKDVYYVGKVISAKDKENDFEVSYLRRSLKCFNSFMFPDIPDLASVALENINMILPAPETSSGTTKRQRCIFKFPVNFSAVDVR
ncbi:hypothetical protein PPYR_00393 [Photinus pyralis]|uniref:DDE-1 domain-containing protein n=1 Tax=Photinus pyralis TaxID=7054 RepID=A0A5N4B1J2_PHOPY|nr:hypothetical protein PPYR_00393 [Photinus pyralis]